MCQGIHCQKINVYLRELRTFDFVENTIIYHFISYSKTFNPFVVKFY